MRSAPPGEPDVGLALECDHVGARRVGHVLRRRAADQHEIAGKDAVRVLGTVGPGKGLATEDAMDGELGPSRELHAPLAARSRVRERCPVTRERCSTSVSTSTR